MIKQKWLRLKKSLTKRYLKTSRLIGSTMYGRMQPTCIVIGTQKGGTTALHKYLSQHPSIVPAIQKELHFFNCDNAYHQGRDHYSRFFEANWPSRKNKITLDVTPDYLFFSYKTAERIHQYNPAVRLIVLLRDPIKRAFSAWQMYKRFYQKNQQWHYKWNCNCGLDDKLKKLVTRPSYGESFLKDVELELRLIEEGLSPEMSVLNYGLYAQQLEPFFRYFNRDQLLIIESSAMRQQTRAHLSKIEAHLNLPAHDWALSDIEPHFEGNYTERITEQEISLLKPFYKPHNDTLFDMLNTRFDWL